MRITGQLIRRDIQSDRLQKSQKMGGLRSENDWRTREIEIQPDRDTIRADGKDLSFGKIKLTAQADGLSKETVAINAAK